MRISGLDDEAIRDLVGAARDSGIDFFDHADVYGPTLHECERRFAEAMRLSPADRENVVIQTKAGIVPEGPYFDFSYEHLIASVEGSLRALQTEYLDILLLHRPDALVEPDEVARASTSSRPRARCGRRGLEPDAPADRPVEEVGPAALVANQLQLSITTRRSWRRAWPRTCTASTSR